MLQSPTRLAPQDFIAARLDEPIDWTTMTEIPSRPRQQAEIAFAKAQSQFLARGRTVAEKNSAARAREEKTLQLKTAREARESEESAKMTDPLLSRQTHQS